MSRAWEEALLDAERRYGSRGGHLLRRGLAADPDPAEGFIRAYAPDGKAYIDIPLDQALDHLFPDGLLDRMG